jgi:hypothetical protein
MQLSCRPALYGWHLAPQSRPRRPIDVWGFIRLCSGSKFAEQLRGRLHGTRRVGQKIDRWANTPYTVEYAQVPAFGETKHIGLRVPFLAVGRRLNRWAHPHTSDVNMLVRTAGPKVGTVRLNRLAGLSCRQRGFAGLGPGQDKQALSLTPSAVAHPSLAGAAAVIALRSPPRAGSYPTTASQDRPARRCWSTYGLSDAVCPATHIADVNISRFSGLSQLNLIDFIHAEPGEM